MYLNNNKATEEMKLATRKTKRLLIEQIKNETGVKTEGLTHKYNLWATQGIKQNPYAPAAIISFANARPMPTRAVMDAAIKALQEDPEYDFELIQKGNRVILRLEVNDLAEEDFDTTSERDTYITLEEIVGGFDD